MPHKCSKIWFLTKTTSKSLLKKGWVFLGFSCFWRPDSKMAPEWAPDLQNHQKITKKHRFSIICSSISALWATDSFSDLLHRIQYVLRCPPHCSTELLAKPRGGTKVLHLFDFTVGVAFFMSVGFRKNIWFGSYFLQASLQFLAANLSGLRRSTYPGCSSKLSLQTVRGCGDGTPQASSINFYVFLWFSSILQLGGCVYSPEVSTSSQFACSL